MMNLNKEWLNMMANDYYNECVADNYIPDFVINFDKLTPFEKNNLAEEWDMNDDEVEYLVKLLAKKFNVK